MEIPILFSEMNPEKNKFVNATIEFQRIIFDEGNGTIIPNHPYKCECDFNKIWNKFKGGENVISIKIFGMKSGEKEIFPIVFSQLSTKQYKELKRVQKQTWIQKDNNLRWLIAFGIGAILTIIGIIVNAKQ